MVTVADLGSLRGGGPCGRVIAGGREAEDMRQPQIAALDTIPPFAIDEALRPREPAARLEPSRQARPAASPNQNAARAARRNLARVEPELVQPLEGLERTLVRPLSIADHARRSASSASSGASAFA